MLPAVLSPQCCVCRSVAVGELPLPSTCYAETTLTAPALSSPLPSYYAAAVCRAVNTTSHCPTALPGLQSSGGCAALCVALRSVFPSLCLPSTERSGWMPDQRNVRQCSATPLLLNHPTVTYHSLVDVDRTTPQLSVQRSTSPGCDWLDVEEVSELLTRLSLPYVDLLRRGVLNEAEVDLLRKLFELQQLDERVMAVRRRAADYVRLFHRVLSGVADERVQSQLVVTLQSLVDADDTVKQMIASTVERSDCNVVSAMMRVLQSTLERSEQPRQLPPHFLACTLCDLITALLLSTLPSSQHEHWVGESLVRDYIDWLLQRPLSLPPAEGGNTDLLTATFKSLRSLASWPPLLSFFHEREGLPRVSVLLLPFIAAEPYQYNLAFLLWLSSFSQSHWDLFLSLDLLPRLLKLLASSRVDKCIRLYLLTVHRLLQHSGDALLDYVVEAALPSRLDSLSQRQWRDADIVELIAAVRSKLHAAQSQLTSWSRYRTELLSASLHPSPPHSSAAFFHSHLEHFAAHNAAVVRRLLGLLNDRRVNAVSRATAASDLGHLATCGEVGKRLLLRDVCGVKETLLHAIERDEEPDADVRHAAVLALQKLLVPHWEEFERQCTLEAVHLTVRPPRRLPERPVSITFT